MGPLETRALDFRNLVVLSANEGMFPRKTFSSSFIPPELRKGFGLPTYEYQDAVWAYYFYRMIQRAEHVWLVYDSRTEGLKSGEESRYIKQLEYHFHLPLERLVASAEMHPVTVEDAIPKTEAHVQAIREAADEVGIDKLMWGSDYPRTITAITYKMSYDFITKSPLLTEAEKAAFLGENARRLFGFGDLPIPKHVKNMSE